MSESFLSMVAGVWEAQKLQCPTLPSHTPVFYRNLEERLDKLRADHGLLTLRLPRSDCVDFSSNDFLSLGSSGLVRMAFFGELARHPGFALGATGSRLLDGNNTYTETVEQELADFHGSECGVLFNSGYEANGAIMSAVPQKGDVIVYDELIHASVHDGMKHSAAEVKRMFRHNDPASLRKVLEEVKQNKPLIRYGQRTVIISIESVYSMDGDVAPVRGLIDVVKEVLPPGQAQFVIDEAHSTGVIGPQGKGLIAELGLEEEMAIRLHTFGKALASTGAVILCNKTIKTTLVNYARSLIYTTGPSFPSLAAIRGAYRLMKDGVTLERQTKLQSVIRHFMTTITANPAFHAAVSADVLSIPVLNDGGVSWKDRSFVTHVVPVWTRPKENHLLAFHLQSNDYVAWPVDYPVVPRESGRVRLVFHAANTLQEAERVAELVVEWATEMMREDAAAAAREGTHLGTSNPIAETDAAVVIEAVTATAVLVKDDDSASSSDDENKSSSGAFTAAMEELAEASMPVKVDAIPMMVDGDIGAKELASATVIEVQNETAAVN